MTNPYRLPNKPSLTIQEVLIWIHKQGSVTIQDIIAYFDITATNAGVRLLKLHRWGYLKRTKSKIPPKIYHYQCSRFGKRQANRWKK